MKVLDRYKDYKVSACGVVTKGDKVIRPYLGKRGYMVVSLTGDGEKPKIAYVHRLVAESHCSGWAAGLYVDHIDGNKLNNSHANLEFVSPGENIVRAHRMGLIPTGANRSTAALTELQAATIFYRLMTGCSQADIVREYKVSKSAVSLMATGRTYKSTASRVGFSPKPRVTYRLEVPKEG